MLTDPVRESHQILTFVCLPLLLLLIAYLILRRRFVQPTSVKFPTFSLSVRRVGREGAYVTLKDSGGTKEFEAEIGRNQIDVRLPEVLTEDQIASVVPQLAQGFQQLRLEYLIYKIGETQEVSESERSGAIADLHKMGFDTDIAPEGRKVRLTRNQAEKQRPHHHEKVDTRKWMHLMRTAGGRRTTLRILARSGAALDRV